LDGSRVPGRPREPRIARHGGVHFFEKSDQLLLFGVYQL
jgi:hypothetical protein